MPASSVAAVSLTFVSAPFLPTLNVTILEFAGGAAPGGASGPGVVSGVTTYRYLSSLLSASSVSVKEPASGVVLLRNVSVPFLAMRNVLTTAPNGDGPPVLTMNAYLPSFVITVQQPA